MVGYDTLGHPNDGGGVLADGEGLGMDGLDGCLNLGDVAVLELGLGVNLGDVLDVSDRVEGDLGLVSELGFGEDQGHGLGDVQRGEHGRRNGTEVGADDGFSNGLQQSFEFGMGSKYRFEGVADLVVGDGGEDGAGIGDVSGLSDVNGHQLSFVLLVVFVHGAVDRSGHKLGLHDWNLNILELGDDGGLGDDLWMAPNGSVLDPLDGNNGTGAVSDT